MPASVIPATAGHSEPAAVNGAPASTPGAPAGAAPPDVSAAAPEIISAEEAYRVGSRILTALFALVALLVTAALLARTV